MEDTLTRTEKKHTHARSGNENFNIKSTVK